MTAATASPRMLAVRQVAEQLGVDPGKVRAWIRSGELIGVNVAATSMGRPRFRIAQTDLELFLLSRRPTPPAPRRRRRRQSEITCYF